MRKLQEEVDAGRLVIPLSSVAYTELAENPRDHQRKPPADGLSDLSEWEVDVLQVQPADGEQVPWLGAALGDQIGPGSADQADGETDDRLQFAEQASGADGAAAGAEGDQPAERGQSVNAALDSSPPTPSRTRSTGSPQDGCE